MVMTSRDDVHYLENVYCHHHLHSVSVFVSFPPFHYVSTLTTQILLTHIKLYKSHVHEFYIWENNAIG